MEEWTLSELQAASDEGDLDATVELAGRYACGIDVDADPQRADMLLKKAAEAGHPKGQNRQGQIYAAGVAVPQNYEEAARWFTLAAQQGHALALANLGILYSMGAGVPVDHVRAYKYLVLAAAYGVEVGIKGLEALQSMISEEDFATARETAKFSSISFILGPPADERAVALFESHQERKKLAGKSNPGEVLSDERWLAYEQNVAEVVVRTFCKFLTDHHGKPVTVSDYFVGEAIVRDQWFTSVNIEGTNVLSENGFPLPYVPDEIVNGVVAAIGLAGGRAWILPTHLHSLIGLDD